MYVAILGRQPALGTAELERRFGAENVAWHSDSSATIKADDFDVTTFGGIQKAGHVVAELSGYDWHKASQKIVQAYSTAWADHDGKLTVGISAYGFDVSPREVQKTGIILKQKLKKAGVSLRLIPNQEAALNTATSHHNKLGLSSNKIELLVIKGKSPKIIIAESVGSQNITAYARRDQDRPKRDAFVGMLPPKLAQLMINLAAGPRTSGRVLDPFCGTGVILQEAALKGFEVYGTDLAEKMVDFTTINLKWLAESHNMDVKSFVHAGDAMETTWKQPIDIVATETYLGQPFSAPPSPTKLSEVRRNCDHIISSFLRNLAPQITSGTPLCIAVPAWRDISGRFTHLDLVDNMANLGYRPVELRHVSKNNLLYYREDQIVARELLILEKI